MRVPFNTAIPDVHGLTKLAALAASHVAFYPSILYNVARCHLQDDWNWYSPVTEHIYLGALPSSAVLQELKLSGVKGVITLNQHYELLVSPADYIAAGFNHLHLPTVDYLYAPSVPELHRATQFIAEHVDRGELVYVHCKAGRGRSTVVVLCYLIKERGMGVQEAWDLVIAKRPQVCLANSQWEVVKQFAASCKAAGAELDSSGKCDAPDGCSNIGDTDDSGVSKHCKAGVELLSLQAAVSQL